MSKIACQAKFEMTINFEKNLMNLKDIEKDVQEYNLQEGRGKFNIESDEDSLTITLDEYNDIFLYENEVTINLKNMDFQEDFKNIYNKILQRQKDINNKSIDVDFEIVTIHDSKNKSCLDLFEVNDEEKELGILFSGYTLFMSDSNDNPCVVEVSPMFREKNLFYTKFVSKHSLEEYDIWTKVDWINEYLNDSFSEMIYKFIEGRNN